MRVEWVEEALDQLADLYVVLSLVDQDALAKSISRINKTLAINPHELGESRTPWVRVWFVDGLIVRFDIDPTKQEVTVYEVSRMRPKKR
jgi:hypothetical protein